MYPETFENEMRFLLSYEHGNRNLVPVVVKFTLKRGLLLGRE